MALNPTLLPNVRAPTSLIFLATSVETDVVYTGATLQSSCLQSVYSDFGRIHFKVSYAPTQLDATTSTEINTYFNLLADGTTRTTLLLPSAAIPTITENTALTPLESESAFTVAEDYTANIGKMFIHDGKLFIITSCTYDEDAGTTKVTTSPDFFSIGGFNLGRIVPGNNILGFDNIVLVAKPTITQDYRVITGSAEFREAVS